MDLNKHIAQPLGDKKPYHSSGYAVIANGDRIGSTSAVPFSQRLQVNESRQIVDVYHRSAIGRTYSNLKAKSIARDRVDIARLNRQRLSSSPSRGSVRFSEPSPRKYNPYS